MATRMCQARGSICSLVFTKCRKRWTMSPTLQVRKPKPQRAMGSRQDWIPRPRGHCELLPPCYPLGLSPAATCGAPVRCCPALSTPRKGGDRQTNAQQRPVGGHSCPTGHAPEAQGKQAAPRREQVLSVSKGDTSDMQTVSPGRAPAPTGIVVIC